MDLIFLEFNDCKKWKGGSCDVDGNYGYKV